MAELRGEWAAASSSAPADDAAGPREAGAKAGLGGKGKRRGRVAWPRRRADGRVFGGNLGEAEAAEVARGLREGVYAKPAAAPMRVGNDSAATYLAVFTSWNPAYEEPREMQVRAASPSPGSGSRADSWPGLVGQLDRVLARPLRQAVGLVDGVDGLVQEEPVRQVADGEHGHLRHGLGRDRDVTQACSSPPPLSSTPRPAPPRARGSPGAR